MKKILALLLALVMIVGLFAGCKNDTPAPTDPTETTGVDENLDKALEYLEAFYMNTPEKVAMDFDRIGTVRIADTPYDIVWSVDVSEDYIKIVVNEDGSVTIDINEETMSDKTEGVPFVLTATLTGTDGRQVSTSWELILSPGIDPEAIAIVEAAYALKDGEVLDGTHTLTGRIISIDTPFSDEYKNITVTMEIKGAEDKPIKCYRLKGEGADSLFVDDIITVTGKIKNYKGTIEFDQGCVLEAVTPGPRVPVTIPTDPKQIVEDAFKLANGGTLYQGADVKLTGRIVKVDYSHKPGADNMSVTIRVEGKNIYCFYLTGTPNMLSQLNVNDIITVEGPIKNYQGKVEFDHPQLLSVSNRTEPLGETDPAKIMADAAKLADGKYLYLSSMTGVITKITSAYSSQYGNISFVMTIDGLEGQTVEAYRVSGKQAAILKVGDQVRVTGAIKNYKGTIEYVGTSDKGANPHPATVTLLKAGVGVPETGDGYTIKFGDLDNVQPENEATLDAGKGYSVYVKECLINDYEVRIYQNNESTNNDGSVTPARDGIVIFTSPEVIKTFKFNTAKYSKDAADLAIYGSADGETWTLIETVSTDPSSAYALELAEGTAYKYLKLDSAKQVRIETVTFNGTVADEDDEPTVVPGTYVTDASQLSTTATYKLGLFSTAKNADYYFTGAMSKYYGATSTEWADAIDVQLETAEGGYYLTFTKDSKQYIAVRNETGDDGKQHTNFKLVAEGGSVFTFDDATDGLCTVVDGTTYYLGTVGNYVTFDAIEAETGAYYGHLYTAAGGSTETPDPTPEYSAPVVGKEYYLAINQVNLGKTIYFNGAMSGYYFATSDSAADGVVVIPEAAADGALYLAFTKDGAKQYINVIQNGNYTNIVMGDSAITAFTYDSDLGILKTTVEGTELYLGTFKSNATISASKLSYINAENVDVSQFPARLISVDGSTTEPSTPAYTTPVVGKEYNLAINQVNLGKTIYFNGAMSGYYFATSDSAADGVVVIPEAAADGALYLAFTKDGAKQYINVIQNGNYTNIVMGDSAITAFTYDSDLGILKTTVEGTELYLGTFKSNATISASKLSYINAENVDVSQFPARLIAVDGSTETPDQPGTGSTTVPAGQFAIFNPEGQMAMSTTNQPYTSGSTTKDQLKPVAATVANGKLTSSAEDLAIFTATANADGQVTFKTADGKYLYADGTHVRLVDTQGEHTLFVLTEEGYLQCANATYGEEQKPQYIRYKYNAFGAFSFSSGSEGAYIMNYVPVGSGSTDTPDTPDTPSVPGGLTTGTYKIKAAYNGEDKYLGAFSSNKFTVASASDAVEYYVVVSGDTLTIYNDETKATIYSYSGKTTSLTAEKTDANTWQWKATEGGYYLYDVTATNRYLGYNSNGTPSFRAYTDKLSDATYGMVLNFVGEGGSTVTPDTPDTPENPPATGSLTSGNYLIKFTYKDVVYYADAFDGGKFTTSSTGEPYYIEVSGNTLYIKDAATKTTYYKYSGSSTGLSAVTTAAGWSYEAITGGYHVYSGTRYLGLSGSNFTIRGYAASNLNSTDYSMVVSFVPYTGTIETPNIPTTPADIMAAAKALAEGKSLPGSYTLTGKVTEVETDSNGNVSVTISVDGTEDTIYCYKITGEGVDALAVGDHIKVTGPIKNYKGTIEFNVCTFVSMDSVAKSAAPATASVADALLPTEEAAQ